MLLRCKSQLTLFAFFLVLVLSGCASDDEEKHKNFTDKQLYELAQTQLDSKAYELVIQNLQLLESRFPFGPYAQHAQLDLIYAHLRNYEPEAAVATADRFIRLHPQHNNVDYAYYMRGLSNYTEGSGLFERFLPTDMAQRDPGAANQSFEDFRQLLIRFPDSVYASDAQARMTYLRNRLARYEINAANYYFKRRAYMAAANRGRYVVENFQQTPAVADALAVMAQAYLIMNMDSLASDSITVLKTNYPDHSSLDVQGDFISQYDPEQQGLSWLNKLTLGLIDPARAPYFDNRPEYMER